jgi:hypothetical protein
MDGVIVLFDGWMDGGEQVVEEVEDLTDSEDVTED